MSDYTPHIDDVAMAYVHATNGDTWVAGRADALRAEFYRWLAEHDREVKAEAWAEGHTHSWRRGPDECQCYAHSWSECACGEYGAGELLSLNDNPYREETE